MPVLFTMLNIIKPGIKIFRRELEIIKSDFRNLKDNSKENLKYNKWTRFICLIADQTMPKGETGKLEHLSRMHLNKSV